MSPVVDVTPVQRLKLRSPEVAVRVPARLLEPVLAAGPGSTTVIVAAPGYGRTTVAALAAAAAGASAWVSCDGFDKRPGRLWQHLDAAAAAAVGTAIGRTVHHDVVAHLDAMLDRWSSGPELLVVLDDVHLALDHAVADQLAYLAAHLPDQVRLVLTSRRDLGGLLTTATSPHPLAVLAEDHLALRPEEAAALLLDAGASPRDPDLDALLALCDGWVTALRQAAAPALVSAASARHALTGISGDALLEPWWSRLRGRLREALLATVDAAVLSPAVCDLLLDRDDSAPLVQALVAEHCYVRPTSSAPGLVGFRRHPVLTSFLQHRRGAATTPPAQHRAVAAWAADHGATDVEVRHLVAAGDVAAAVETVHRHEERLLHERRTDEVLAWYSLLPEEAIGSQAWLVLRRGWGELLSGRHDQADREHRWLVALLGTTGPQDPDRRELAAEAAALGATIAAYRADPDTMLAESRSARALFGEAWDRPVHEMLAVSEARALLWLGRTEEAHEVVQAAQRRPGVSRLTRDVLLTGVAGATALYRGEVRQALALAERALADLQPSDIGTSPLGESAARVVQGLAHLELADLDSAEQQLSASLAAAHDAGELALEVITLSGLARTSAVRGDLVTAFGRHEEAVALLRRRSPGSGLLALLDGAGAGLRLQGGDPARAARLLAGAAPGPATTLLQVRLAQLRRPGAGVARLQGLEPRDTRSAVERLVLLACAYAPSRHDRAGVLFADAAQQADAAGLRLALLGVPSDALEIAGMTAARTGNATLAQLVGIARRASTGRAVAAAAGRGHDLPPLSAGERQLLVLLPGRDSNAALAASLSVSVNTLKTRLRRLYTKLDVHTRDEAIRAARSRGLIA